MKYLRYFENYKKSGFTPNYKKSGFTPKDFKKFNWPPMGSDLKHYEYEEFLAILINKHIKNNQPFNKPFKYQYDHDSMVKKGYLKDHGNNYYTATNNALAILYEYQQKEIKKITDQFDL